VLSAIHDIVTKSEQGMPSDPLVFTDVTINDNWLRGNSVAGFREIDTRSFPRRNGRGGDRHACLRASVLRGMKDVIHTFSAVSSPSFRVRIT
jgi:hypothetical protein